jgi:hypothetical protein
MERRPGSATPQSLTYAQLSIKTGDRSVTRNSFSCRRTIDTQYGCIRVNMDPSARFTATGVPCEELGVYVRKIHSVFGNWRVFSSHPAQTKPRRHFLCRDDDEVTLNTGARP